MQTHKIKTSFNPCLLQSNNQTPNLISIAIVIVIVIAVAISILLSLSLCIFAFAYAYANALSCTFISIAFLSCGFWGNLGTVIVRTPSTEVALIFPKSELLGN
jgi:hypothetical protein